MFEIFFELEVVCIVLFILDMYLFIDFMFDMVFESYGLMLLVLGVEVVSGSDMLFICDVGSEVVEEVCGCVVLSIIGFVVLLLKVWWICFGVFCFVVKIVILFMRCIRVVIVMFVMLFILVSILSCFRVFWIVCSVIVSEIL